jgi:small subunit ribosomal protein S24e
VSHRTRITFVTAGWLLQYLTHVSADANQQRFPFTHAIVDEAHERSVDTDLITMLLRRMLDPSDPTLHSKNPNLKLILMSATIHANHFLDYFADVTSSLSSVAIPTTHPFPIEHVYLEDLRDWLDTAGHKQLDALSSAGVAAAVKRQNALAKRGLPAIGENFPKLESKMCSLIATLATRLAKPKKNVLVFVGGFMDIDAVASELQARSPLEVVMLHSQIDLPFQLQSLLDTDAPVVYIATNIAESSLTLPNVHYVLDAGITKRIQ